MEKLTLGFAIAFFLLMLGLSIIAYAIRRAERYEPDNDAIDMDSMEPVNYKDIQECERPYIEHQYN